MRICGLVFLLCVAVASQAQTPPCIVETIAGGGANRDTPGPALEAQLTSPAGIAVAEDGAVYVADRARQRVFRIRTDGVLETVAGTSERGRPTDGALAVESPLFEPVDVALGPNGDLYVATRAGGQIHRIDAEGRIHLVAGTGERWCLSPLCGEGEPATSAETPLPIQVEVDSQGVVYVVHDLSSAGLATVWVRRIGLDGRIQMLPPQEGVGRPSIRAIDLDAGDRPLLGVFQDQDPQYYLLDDDALVPYSTTAGFLRPANAVAAAPDGGFYVADGRFGIRRVTADGRIYRIAGERRGGFEGDGGPAREARFNNIWGLEVGPAGDLWIADRGNARVRRIAQVADCPLIEEPEIAVGGVVNGADYRRILAPGAVFSVFGRGLGPASLVGGEFGGDGRLTTELAGVRVLVDDLPAPLIFALDGQLSGVVPFSVGEGPLLRVAVEVDGRRSDFESPQQHPTAPAVFTLDASGRGPAAALNQDGSVNTADNPAAPGSVVVLYGTGGGVPPEPPLDGAVAPGAAPLAHPVTAEVGFEPADVLYAGAAPGLVEGVIQINLRIAQSLSAGPQPIRLAIGERATESRVDRRPTVFVAGEP